MEGKEVKRQHLLVGEPGVILLYVYHPTDLILMGPELEVQVLQEQHLVTAVTDLTQQLVQMVGDREVEEVQELILQTFLHHKPEMEEI